MSIKASKLKSLSYDEILLVPKQSSINSRDDINLFYKDESSFPIFSAPMKAISTVKLVIELGKLGGVGILHRFFTRQRDRYESIETISHSSVEYGVAIGLEDVSNNIDLLNFLESKNCSYVCLDVAYGGLNKVQGAIKYISERKHSLNHSYKIIAGNIATQDGAYRLWKSGTEFARVGIGGGSVCSSRNVTGCAVPDLTAIQDCSKINNRNFLSGLFPKNGKNRMSIVADGGIKSSGEAIKALVFGATHLMVGGLLAKSIEADNNGEFYGMSSAKLQTEMGKYLKSNEGLIKQIPTNEIRPLKDIYSEFLYGIKSGFSYLGCSNINDLREMDIQYIKVGKGAIKNL